MPRSRAGVELVWVMSYRMVPEVLHVLLSLPIGCNCSKEPCLERGCWKDVHYKAPYSSIEGRDRDSFFSAARAPPAPDICVDTARVLRVHQQAAAVLSDFQEDLEVVQGHMQWAASDGSGGQVDLVRISGNGLALVIAPYHGSLDKGYLQLQLHDRVDVSYVGESDIAPDVAIVLPSWTR